MISWLGSTVPGENSFISCLEVNNSLEESKRKLSLLQTHTKQASILY